MHITVEMLPLLIWPSRNWARKNKLYTLGGRNFRRKKLYISQELTIANQAFKNILGVKYFVIRWLFFLSYLDLNFWKFHDWKKIQINFIYGNKPLRIRFIKFFAEIIFTNLTKFAKISSLKVMKLLSLSAKFKACLNNLVQGSLSRKIYHSFHRLRWRTRRSC